MQLDIHTGLLADTDFLPSPNCDERPEGVEVDTLIIHGISLPPGEFGGGFVEQLFSNALDCDAHPYFKTLAGVEVSAHFLIRRNGQLVQFVQTHLRAWHAGQSCCEGRERVNDFSIGVELEGTDELPYTDAQYQAVARLSCALFKAYPAMTLDRVYGHNDIAPGRKTDPGPAFDWVQYRVLCADV
ncbi:MAG: 1,6-anhydro-N-acetylmuramyl-L-alanine amidase AmpD [Gammaproteobacteria bacterium]|nr:MAG: 1,6-anhydro-N-acetylmuramyl-L-alanine amidase AmpD [Gammaproteobacteria bacterium]